MPPKKKKSAPRRQRPSEFDTWFHAEFGTEPSKGVSLLELRERVAHTRAALMYAEMDLRDRELWNATREAAVRGYASGKRAVK